MDVSAPEPLHNRWLNDYISPGVVGSVGDTHLHQRLKHSAPELPIRWDPRTNGKNLPPLGSNVQDGWQENASGWSARVIDHNWDIPRKRRYVKSWRYQTLTPEDCSQSAMPTVGPLPQFSWKNQVATIYKSLHTGNKFLPVPGAYELPPGGIPRGGNVPRIVASVVDPEPLLINPGPGDRFTNVSNTTGAFQIGGSQRFGDPQPALVQVPATPAIR